MRKKILTALTAILLFFPILQHPAEAASLRWKPDESLHEMSDTLYGLFFEDINHAVEGGLYAELLQNRSFENEDLLNPKDYQHLTGWQFNTRVGCSGTVRTERSDPLHVQNPVYVRVEAADAGYSFQNTGYAASAFRGGISVREGQAYDVSVWLRGVKYQGSISAALTTRSGNPLSEAVSWEPSEEWTRFSGVLIAGETSEEACLTFTMAAPGTIDADMASLMSEDRIGSDWPGGGVRRDLTEALKALQPRVLRFPGGCVVEGSWVWDNLYRWKDTVGSVEQRRENWDTWGYMQSNGVGFYEYFCLCEEIGALPLPVVGSGVLCQAREPAESPMNEEELAAWTEDVLDLAEFALGDPDTEWGRLRCEMGHEAPFDLRYLAIGNENWGDVYFKRYEKIREAVKEKYPSLTCIIACGPVASGSLFNASRSKILHSFAEDMADEHYYMESEWFLRNTHRYDQYPRTTKIFLGEFAAHEPAAGGRRPNNLYSALCEAAYLTGIERNSDVVAACCYAPLLARYGMDQWTPDLIWFNGSRIVLTPNYYIQRMFASTLGNHVLSSRMTDDEEKTLNDTRTGLYHVVTGLEDGTVYIKVVNVSGTEQDILLQEENAGKGRNVSGTMMLLAGEKQDQNTLKEEKIVPVTSDFSLEDGQALLKLPPYAAAVITLPGDVN